MQELQLDRLLLLTLISSVVHTKFYEATNITTEYVSLTSAPAPAPAPILPTPAFVPLPDVPKSETQHTPFDTLSFIIPILLALQHSPLVRTALLAMSSWEKLNRKLRAVKEFRAVCKCLVRLILSMLVMWYPVGGIKDFEEVWDSIMARKKRGRRVRVDVDVSQAPLEETKDSGKDIFGNTGNLVKEPICRRRRNMAGPGRLLVRKAQEPEMSFLSSARWEAKDSFKERGYARAVMDVDLPVVCPPTV